MEDQKIKVHPFARSLGPPPYSFQGYGQVVISESRGAFYAGPSIERGAGTCAHCGTAITIVCVVRTGEGRQFGVGTDCVLKVGMPVQEMTKIQLAKKQLDRVKRAEAKKKREIKLYAQVQELVTKNNLALQALPHPHPYLASQGKTALDYVNFCARPMSSEGVLKTVLNKLNSFLEKVG
jgi:hypothetical protein